jgi:hypothetical protein
MPIDPQLKTAMELAAENSNVKIRVTSGGQPAAGTPGAKRTGSLRHDRGRAADIDILDPKTGKVLSLDDPRRIKFMEEAAAAGAGGTGARYMSDPNKVHVGITGSRGVVGEGLGAYAGSAEERAAVARGLKRMMTPEQVAAARQKQIDARKSNETPSSVVEATPAEEKEDREKAYEKSPFLKSRGAPADQNVEQRVNLKVNDNDVQFARASMRRGADREVREARWNSYSDIGAA